MCSEFRLAGGVIALLVLFSGGPGRAEDISTPEGDAATAGDASDPNCSADLKRAKRAALAQDKRMAREAVAIARTTIANAELIAMNHWEETDRRWFERIRAAGRTRLESWRDAVGSLPSIPLCRALAAREPSHCTPLNSEDERRACTHWHEVWTHGRPGGDCAKATQGVQGACRMIVAGAPWRCGETHGGALDLCGRAANVLQAAEATCGAPPDPHLCTWSLWMRAIRGGADVCSIVEGGGAGPKRPGIAGRCHAVAEGRPDLCAVAGAPTAAGRPPVVFHAEASLSEGAFEPRALVSVQTDTPSVCGVLTRITRPSGEEVHRDLTVLPLNSWSPVELRETLPQDLLDVTALTAKVSVTCAVRIVW